MKRVAPSLVTLGAVFAALLAIIWAGPHPYWACNAIIAAALCDMIDGRVARLLDAQSELGGQLDSLADVVAFGVAPAILMYHHIAPPEPSLLWILPGFLFVASSAIRLARFNVSSDQEESFRGIPTPVAALTVTTSVMTWHELEWKIFSEPWLGVSALLLTALLMVLPLRFSSFKKFPNRALQIAYFGSMACGLTLLFVGRPGGAVLLGLLLIYILRGLAAGLLPRPRSA